MKLKKLMLSGERIKSWKDMWIKIRKLEKKLLSIKIKLGYYLKNLKDCSQFLGITMKSIKK